MKLLVDGQEVAVKKVLEIIWESGDGENTLHLHACDGGIAIQEFAFELLVGEFHCITSEIPGFCSEPESQQVTTISRKDVADRLLDLVQPERDRKITITNLDTP